MIEQLKTIRYLMDTYCPECHDGYAALTQLEAMVGEQEPVAKLHDDGYWTPMKTEAGRALNDRLMRAGSPSIDVYAAPVTQQPQAEPDIHEAQGQIEFLDKKNNALSAAIRKVMARLADLLDEDQFKEIEETISSAGVQPQDEAVQACGHSMSLLLRSAESNEPLYCEACDDKSGRHDAEHRETELLDANRSLQEKIGSADALKLHAIEELCQLGYTVKDGELIPPDHLHKLVEAAGHPLAAPQQAEAVPPDAVRDAAAYHWLTTTLTSPEPWVVFQKAFGHMTEERPPTKAELDAAIYAAIAQQKGGV